jgi:hypothetical protein
MWGIEMIFSRCAWGCRFASSAYLLVTDRKGNVMNFAYGHSFSSSSSGWIADVPMPCILA